MGYNRRERNMAARIQHARTQVVTPELEKGGTSPPDSSIIACHTRRCPQTSCAGVVVVAGAAGGVLSLGGVGVVLLGFGGLGARPSIISPICSESMVSHSSRALAMTSILSRFSSISLRARLYCVSM